MAPISFTFTEITVGSTVSIWSLAMIVMLVSLCAKRQRKQNSGTSFKGYEAPAGFIEEKQTFNPAYRSSIVGNPDGEMTGLKSPIERISVAQEDAVKGYMSVSDPGDSADVRLGKGNEINKDKPHRDLAGLKTTREEERAAKLKALREKRANKKADEEAELLAALADIDSMEA